MGYGRKTVVVGQTIDPDTWGNPLWDQSVQTFTSAADRTAQFPAPKLGAVTWLDDVKRLDVWNGTAWRAVDAETRDWSFEMSSDKAFAAGAGVYTDVMTLTIPATAPPGRYLFLWTLVGSVASGTAAATTRLTVNGASISEPRSDFDAILARPYTFTKTYGNAGGAALTVVVQVNAPSAAGTIRAQGSNVRAVFL